jgi:hypothetical protein
MEHVLESWNTMTSPVESVTHYRVDFQFQQKAARVWVCTKKDVSMDGPWEEGYYLGPPPAPKPLKERKWKQIKPITIKGLKEDSACVSRMDYLMREAIERGFHIHNETNWNINYLLEWDQFTDEDIMWLRDKDYIQEVNDNENKEG